MTLRHACTLFFLSCLLFPLAAIAQSPSPYDLTYRLRDKVPQPLYRDMADDAAQIGTLPADASGIILRWCRPEIPFGGWQFGSRAEQLKLLDVRWCEISHGKTVGSVKGRVLAPE